jgi:predicted nucleic acid-binding OB-fold protein
MPSSPDSSSGGGGFNRVTRWLTYHTLTQDAQDRLKETIAAIIADNEQRFINWYNNAQPILTWQLV